MLRPLPISLIPVTLPAAQWRLVPLMLVLLLPLLAGCGGDPGPSVTRADSAGVALVTTAGGDVALGWRFEERLRLGGADGGPESFYVVSRDRVSAGPDGAIHVLDGGAHRVVVFDSAGRHLRTVGREGGGPGELQMPVGLAVDSAGVVGVWDYGKPGIVRFGPDGAPRPTLSSTSFYRGGGIRLHEDGAVFLTSDFRDPEARAVALVMMDTTGTEWEEGWTGVRTVTRRVTPDAGVQTFERCGVAFRLPPLFHPDLEWAAGPGGRLFVAGEVGYVVDVYEDTSRVASYRRALEPRVATRELAELSLGEGLTVSVSGGPPCTVPAGEVVDARGFAESIPLIDRLIVDPTGRTWVIRTAIGQEPTRVDILSPDGAYLGTLTDPPLPVAFLPNGDVMAEFTDEFDVDQLVVYRLLGAGAERPAG